MATNEPAVATPRGVIAGHATFAAGLVSAVQQIAGKGDVFTAVSNAGLSGADIETTILRALDTSNANVLFTDLPAGSCTMSARRLQRSRPQLVVRDRCQSRNRSRVCISPRRRIRRRCRKSSGRERARDADGISLICRSHCTASTIVSFTGRSWLDGDNRSSCVSSCWSMTTSHPASGKQELYRMGVPPEMDVQFCDVASAGSALAKYSLDARIGLVLVGDIGTMQRLVASNPGIKTVNVGGVHHSPGRTPRLRYVFLTPSEEEGLRAIAATGVEVTAQDVPGARPVPLDELLSNSPRCVSRMFNDAVDAGILPRLIDLVPLSLLGGILGLDVVSFPQAMISRPIVAASLGGAFAGDAMAGLICGAALECLAVESLPVGASRYPEWGSASTVAGVLAAQGAAGSIIPQAGSLAIAVVIGNIHRMGGRLDDVRHRRLIASWARPRLDSLAAGNVRTMMSLQLFGITFDFLRGMFLTMVMLIPTLWFTDWANAHWNLNADITKAVVVTSVAAVAAAAIWKDFHAIAGTRRLFLRGLSRWAQWE